MFCISDRFQVVTKLHMRTANLPELIGVYTKMNPSWENKLVLFNFFREMPVFYLQETVLYGPRDFAFLVSRYMNKLNCTDYRGEKKSFSF